MSRPGLSRKASCDQRTRKSQFRRTVLGSRGEEWKKTAAVGKIRPRPDDNGSAVPGKVRSAGGATCLAATGSEQGCNGRGRGRSTDGAPHRPVRKKRSGLARSVPAAVVSPRSKSDWEPLTDCCGFAPPTIGGDPNWTARFTQPSAARTRAVTDLCNIACQYEGGKRSSP